MDRNPRDLQGLLKFCMEATKAEDAPLASSLEEMDPEKKRWLDEALKSMTVDVFQELAKGIKILSDETVVCDPEATDLGDQLETFDCIEDWVGQVDMANNFHKLGGFVALDLCLRKSPHEAIISGACHIVAELAQNNPYCQEHFVKEGFLVPILDIMTKYDDRLKAKALYAISCITREFPPGQEKLIELKGLEVIVKTLQTSADEKVKIKSCFMLCALVTENSKVKSILNEMALCQLLAGIFCGERDASHEHILRLMLLLCEEDEKAQNDCKQTGLENQLQESIRFFTGKSEFQEEETYCKKLVDLLYPSSGSVTVER